MGKSRSTPCCSPNRSSPRPISLGYHWIGEGAREGEGAEKKGGGVSGREEHEQDEGEWLLGKGCCF